MNLVPEDRWQLSLDLKNDPELRRRVEEVMRRERRRKRADFVRAAVEAYLEAAELRLGIVQRDDGPARSAVRPPGA